MIKTYEHDGELTLSIKDIGSLVCRYTDVQALQKELARVTAERDEGYAYRRQVENALGLPVDTRGAYSPGVLVSNLKNERDNLATVLRQVEQWVDPATNPRQETTWELLKEIRSVLSAKNQ